jgi:hypothetical protein
VTYGNVTLNQTESANITDDTSPNETWTGLEARYAYPNGQVITQDTGPIVFDGSGNIVYEQGQHPFADGPGNDAVCAALGAS